MLLQLPMASAIESWAPSAVLGTSLTTAENGGTALVTWLPGRQLADSYNVYGVAGSSLVLLTTALATDTSATTPAGYQAYAVTGVKAGVESEAVLTPVVPCVYVDLLPPGGPDAAVDDCTGTIPIGV